MKSINGVISLVIFLFFLSCTRNNKENNLFLNSELKDSTENSSLNSAIDYNGNNEPSDNELFQKSYDELIKSYKKAEIVESLYIFGIDTFYVNMNYNCKNNSIIIIPKQYLEPYLNYDFNTHDFELIITIKKNQELFLKRIYNKKDFFNQLQNENLKKFGIILYPYIEEINKEIIVNASISIPLTDIGEGVSDTIQLW